MYRSEVSYDDSIDPPAHGGIAGVSAYLFSEVRFMRPNPDRPGEIETVVIEPGGYAFQMVRGMGGGGRIGAEATPAKDPISKMSASSVWYSRDAPGSGPWVSPAFAHRTSEARAGWRSPLAQSTLRDWNRRIDQAQAFRERIDEYRGLRDWVDDPPPDDAIDELGNAQHYSDGLEAATRGTAAGLGWIGPQQQRQYDALRMAEEKLRTLPGDSEKSDDPGGRVVVVVVYAPSRDTGAPGSAESQFRGFSGR